MKTCLVFSIVLIQLNATGEFLLSRKEVLKCLKCARLWMGQRNPATVVQWLRNPLIIPGFSVFHRNPESYQLVQDFFHSQYISVQVC